MEKRPDTSQTKEEVMNNSIIITPESINRLANSIHEDKRKLENLHGPYSYDVADIKAVIENWLQEQIALTKFTKTFTH